MNQPNPSCERKYAIGVRMLIPENFTIIAPGNNHIATIVTSRLIKTELALDGIEATVYLVGPFNQLQGIVHVDDLSSGLRAVERVFADLNLVFEIAWWDTQENRWQIHPYGDGYEFNKRFGDVSGSGLKEQIQLWMDQLSKGGQA